MQIIQKILIKQVITENSKKRLQSKFQQEIVQLERECQQLQFEKRKLQSRITSKKGVSDRFHQEIARRKDNIKIIEFKLEQLALLEIGSEIIEKEVDGFTNVEIGMDWRSVNKNPAIIIKDDIVIRIDKE